MKRVIKGAIVFMLLYFCIMGNQQTIHAETVDVQNEYLQKKSAGREVYEITSQSGKFMGYYEPSFLENLDIMPRTRVRYNVGNWTISANTTSWTTTIHSWIKGDKITVNISQNHSGRNYGGYLGLRDNDDGTVAVKFDQTSKAEIYEYDPAGRIIRIMNQRGETLKTYEYNNFKQQ